MALIEGIVAIAQLSSLAGVMIKAWQVLSQKNEQRLEREWQLLLQEEQHRHERSLALVRTGEPAAALISVPSESHSMLETTSPLLKRLQLEAETLTSYGFDVAYELLPEGGYGLALPIGDDLMFCFLLSYAYPYREPTVLIKAGDELQQVSFEPDAWQYEVTIASVVQNMVSAYFAEENGSPTLPAATTNP